MRVLTDKCEVNGNECMVVIEGETSHELDGPLLKQLAIQYGRQIGLNQPGVSEITGVYASEVNPGKFCRDIRISGQP